jgi:hypothetical protein
MECIHPSTTGMVAGPYFVRARYASLVRTFYSSLLS